MTSTTSSQDRRTRRCYVCEIALGVAAVLCWEERPYKVCEDCQRRYGIERPWKDWPNPPDLTDVDIPF